MAKKTTDTTRPEDLSIVMHYIKVMNLTRTKVEIKEWRNALQAAENIFMPFRVELYRVYQELWLDAHLHAIMQKRIRNVKNKKIVLRSTNEEIDPKLNKQIEKMWFYDLINLIMESLFWGHSLVEFETDGYDIKCVKLVPRHHVNPELGIICKRSPYDREGIPFRDGDAAPYLVEVNWHFGLMNIAAANTIYKKYGVIDYSNFVEVFGSPIREFRYDNKIQGAKEEADSLADKQGNSSAISVPKDSVELTLHKGADGNSGNLHGGFVEMLKDELTILVLGQTMTTKDGSSRSQGEVHLEEQDEVTQDDIKRVVYFLNEVVKPKLIGLGMKIEDCEFEYLPNKKLPVKEQLDIAKTLKLDLGLAIDDDYFYDLAGIPKPKNAKTGESAEQEKEDPEEIEDPEEDPATKKKTSVTPKA